MPPLSEEGTVACLQQQASVSARRQTDLVWAMKKRDLEIVPDLIPHEKDVTCGRGKHRWGSAGNMRYKRIINENIDGYVSAPSKSDKSKIVRGIVETIRSDGSRFIKRDRQNGLWIELTQLEIRTKVAHALRDVSRAVAFSLPPDIVGASASSRDGAIMNNKDQQPEVNIGLLVRPSSFDEGALSSEEDDDALSKIIGAMSHDEDDDEQEEEFDIEPAALLVDLGRAEGAGRGGRAAPLVPNPPAAASYQHQHDQHHHRSPFPFYGLPPTQPRSGTNMPPVLGFSGFVGQQQEQQQQPLLSSDTDHHLVTAAAFDPSLSYFLGIGSCGTSVADEATRRGSTTNAVLPLNYHGPSSGVSSAAPAESTTSFSSPWPSSVLLQGDNNYSFMPRTSNNNILMPPGFMFATGDAYDSQQSQPLLMDHRNKQEERDEQFPTIRSEKEEQQDLVGYQKGGGRNQQHHPPLPFDNYDDSAVFPLTTTISSNASAPLHHYHNTTGGDFRWSPLLASSFVASGASPLFLSSVPPPPPPAFSMNPLVLRTNQQDLMPHRHEDNPSTEQLRYGQQQQQHANHHQHPLPSDVAIQAQHFPHFSPSHLLVDGQQHDPGEEEGARNSNRKQKREWNKTRGGGEGYS